MKKQNTSEELKTAKAELVFQNKEKKKRAAELIIANKELVFQNKEKKKRAAELAIANKELGFQNKEKKNRAAELVIANKELVFQNKEKEKRAAELSIANKELLFQNGQKEKRAQELEIALGELVANEKRYNALIENSADAILILSETGKPSYVSSSIEKILGYTGKEVMQMDILSIAHPDDLEPLAAVIQQVLANPGVPLKGHTGRMRHKNGSWRWLEATVTNMLHDPAIKGIVDNLRDVTENKFAEEKINHLNRLYAFISQINQAIVHSAHEQELFNAACKIAVNVGKFKLAFIGIVNEENGKINLVAEDGAISTDLEVFSSVAYNKNGPVAKLLQSGTLHAINNIAASYLDDRWKQYALTRGFKANIYLAIKKSGKTTAIFTLISAEADFFNQEEIALLAQAADDISFALSVFEKEKLKVNAEEALRESESNLQAIFENSSEGFILTDLAGNIKTFNKKAKEIFLANSGKEIIKGTSIFNFVRESTKEIYKAAIPKVLAGEYLQYDLSFERENGEINWFNFVINRVYNEETVEGFSIKASDITGNKEAEITLRQSELRYRQIVETAQEGIWTIDAADKTTFVNQKMCDIIGYTSAEMMGKTKLFFKDEEGLKIAKDILQKRSKTITETYESSFLTKDGRRIWTQISTNPIINDAGIYQGSLFMVADITDKKRLEKAIENERDQFFEIFSKAPSAIGMLKGADHVYEMVNPVNLQLIGKKDVIGKRAAEVLPEFIEQGIIDMLDRVYTTGKTHIDTEVLIKIDKEGKGELTDVYLNSVYQAYRNNEGKIEGILFFSNDVTEQILSRKAIEKSEKFFKGVIENSADMITMIDAAGNTMYASPAVAKKFGYSSEECLQINLADIVHTDDAL
ncbi:MAG: PAS domain S-box protein, partial [Ferruginibacter sp.]